MKGTTKQPKAKSLLLSKAEKSDLKKFVDSFLTVVAAANALGVSRQVLDRVLLTGQGSPDNIKMINKKVAKWHTTQYESAA